MNSKTDQKINFSIFIILLGVMTTFGPLLSDLYTPSLPGVAEDLNTSASSVQLSLSIAMIGIALGQFIFGPLSDKYGKKLSTLGLMLVFILSSIGCMFAHNITLLIVFRFIQGLMGGGAIVIARATAGNLYNGKKLAKFLAILMVINGILTIIIPLISGLLLSYSTWRSIFTLLAIIGVVLMIVAFFSMKSDRDDVKASPISFKEVIEDFGRLLKTKRYMVPLLIQSITYIMLFSYASSAPFITQTIYHLSPQQYSIFMTVIGIGLIISSQTAGKLVDYFDRGNIIFGMFGLQVLGGILVIIALLMHLPVWVYMISVFFTVVPVAGVGPLAFSIAMEERTGGSGNAASLLGLTQFIIGSIIAPLAGIMGASNVWPYVTIISITIVLIFIISFLSKKTFKA
ncbi:multidrug effflux MFS transporter [Staphylococcus massiliensis]|uniref:multidrug effflux MFS transporter n=1 Tax=Staphylococcus massiliensis TaxID=555791 RepID=UPI001EDDC328|nr:multidrug effflux MFS transporter [Staphylococcus massiliensis]MCG3399189.1 multidrug effflux MFS transporter [Staphylococcus massiliensis]MCG3412791.1 multidrug effflux MFS transporter [Staphylococcus massiliensis]